MTHVGGAAGRREQVLEALDLVGSVEGLVLDDDRVAVATHVGVRIGVEIELGAEDLAGLDQHGGVADGPHAAAPAEDLDANAQPAEQRLAELEADDARPEHRNALGQVVELEDLVVGDQPVAERVPRRRKGRRGAGGDDDRLRDDRRTAVDRQRVVVDEGRATEDLVGRRDLVDAARDEADEAVAFALHALHHGLAVDHQRCVDRQAERRQPVEQVRGFGRRDQQLARHAAHARAGGAV